MLGDDGVVWIDGVARDGLVEKVRVVVDGGVVRDDRVVRDYDEVVEDCRLINSLEMRGWYRV